MSLILFINIILFILYFIFGDKKLNHFLGNIIKQKKNIKINKILSNDKNKNWLFKYSIETKKSEKIKNIKKKNKKSNKKSKNIFQLNKYNINQNIKNNNVLNFQKKISSPPKKILLSNISSKLNVNNIINKSETNNIITSKDSYKKNKQKKIKKNKRQQKLNKNSEINKKINNNATELKTFKKKNNILNTKKPKFTNEELNNMKYTIALIYDKRTYLEYYWSLLKTKHLILRILFNKEDYNLITLKIALFFVSFSLYFSVNGFFFYDDTMHKIYIDNGYYDIIYQIPILIYSTIISSFINFIMKRLSISEQKILEIKKEKNIIKIKEAFKKVLIKCKIQFIFFFIFNFLLILFFWYFISCFCSVYKNTQIILINDTLISFGLSMIYPFGLNLLPGLFRIPSLRVKKKDKECLYKASTLFSLI